MSEVFYPVTPEMPAIGVRVVVVHEARQFLAGRAVDKKARAVRWATDQCGKLVWLRGEPDAWRPEKPDLWKAPLPEPLASTVPQMADIRPRRNRYAAMAAQAEQSARAQAEIRDELGEAADGQRASGSDKQWWHDEPLTYSAPGEISVREAEGRVARAILTDGIRGRYGGPPGLMETSSALSGFVHETLLSSDADGMRAVFEPTPRDLDDYPVALAWFAALNPPELWHKARASWGLSRAQCVLVWRVINPPLSWRKIVKQVGGSHAGARQVYGAALDGVHRAANGQPVLKHVRVADRMQALKARNRRARVEGTNTRNALLAEVAADILGDTSGGKHG